MCITEQLDFFKFEITQQQKFGENQNKKQEA